MNNRRLATFAASVAATLGAAVAVQAQTAFPPVKPTTDPGTGVKTLPCEDTSGRPVDVPAFSLGESFEGHQMMKRLRRCDPPSPDGRTNYVSHIYGDCDARGGSGCQPPLEVQSFAACERHADSYSYGPNGGPLPRETIKLGPHPGAIFEEGHRVEMYLRDATVVVFGTDPAQVMRASHKVQRLAPMPGRITVDCAVAAGE